MAKDHIYSYFRVSKSDAVHESAQKYRDLRLRALQASPASFSSTYDIEAAFSESDWVERLTIPGREVFICAATAPNQSANGSDWVNWVGQVTIRGPLSQAEFTLPAESGQPDPRSDQEEERWQMLSLFILPEHQGGGLGGNLCREALGYLQHYQPSPPSVLVRLMVKVENQATVRLYQRLGFAVVGMSTLAEALIANGDGHLLPKDLSDTKYSGRRGGVIMTFRMFRA
ncbi:hypothetical protein N7468_001793 [Penicillium chermesinum]|uniref:N-acetyltransferase domain-containing protein n=1 Tax=Penicillium chermesinum TaxID=63820 RepID=A0A9W9PHG0_9EURO|nr:uncharacterized protein N7468_001793 [Penicillium chermesinum]KAJ5246810.1 hypothetical protein N7468_001793 [Penicillium chermesinum]KAJ6145072.1 hypothetical protein N7470_008967 [Penicillium chermesinum]